VEYIIYSKTLWEYNEVEERDHFDSDACILDDESKVFALLFTSLYYILL